jgi:hypothetical protein
MALSSGPNLDAEDFHSRAAVARSIEGTASAIQLVLGCHPTQPDLGALASDRFVFNEASSGCP